MSRPAVPTGVNIPDKVYFRIGEVSRLLGVKTYVLRFWETEFPMVIPQKSASNQRVYRRTDVEKLFLIRHLLYVEKYSIAGARKRVKSFRAETSLRGLAQELREIARTPISSLFRLG